MRSSQVGGRSALTAIAALVLAAAAALAVTPFGSEASGNGGAGGAGGMGGLLFGTGSASQKAIASKKAITVSVTATGSTASVTVKLVRGSSATTVAGPKTLTLRNGKATSAIPTTAYGRTRLNSCSGGNIVIFVGGLEVRREPLYVDSTTCTGRAPKVDTGTASRCDVIDPSVCLYPFPNDHFTKVDSSKATGKRININPLSSPASTKVPFVVDGKPMDVTDINRFDGFSPGAMLLTHIDGLTSEAAMQQSGLVPLTDLDRYADPNQAAVLIDTVTGQRHPIWAELDSSLRNENLPPNLQAQPTYDAAKDAVLIIRPARNLVDGRRYVVGLRNLKTATGAAIAPTDGFRIYRDRLVTRSSVIESRRAKMESIFSTLETAGISRSSLNTAWDFTVASTRSLSERMLKIRDDAFAQIGDTTMADKTIQGSSPAFSINPTTNPDGGRYPKGIVDTPDDPDRYRRIDGVIEVPCYLTTTGCTPGGVFSYGTDGLPKQTPGNKQLARFRCNVPQSAFDGNGPIDIAMYGHGLFNEMWELDSRNVRQLGNENRMMICGTDWIGMTDEDILTAAGILSRLGDFPKIADRLQQGYLAFMYLGRALAHSAGLTTNAAFKPTKDGRTPSYNLAEVNYYGNSQGGIAGGGLTAVSPDIRRSVLYVGGMNYSTLLTRSIDFDAYATVMYNAYKTLRERPLLFAMIQLMWDRGEPNGYANHITANPLPNTPAKKVMMAMSYGDHQVANVSTEVQARTMGLKLRTPYLYPGRDVNGSIYGWGLPTLGALPADENALIAWDIGPFRTPPNATALAACRRGSSATTCGTDSPPATNLPPRRGTDPHDFNIESMASLRRQIAEYIKPNGTLIEVCGASPCYGGGFTGP